jgi:hypothetical protein
VERGKRRRKKERIKKGRERENKKIDKQIKR